MIPTPDQIAVSIEAQTGIAVSGEQAAAMARMLEAQLTTGRRFLARMSRVEAPEDHAAALAALAPDDA